MDRHWTLDVVALAAVLAGFVLFASGSAATLPGVVAASGAYAVLVPELVSADPPRVSPSRTAETGATAGRAKSVEPPQTADRGRSV